MSRKSTVFARYQPAAAGIVRVWKESWEKRGWTPRLLSAREIKEAGTKAQAIRRRGGGRLVSLGAINFSFQAPQRIAPRVVAHKSPGWQTASVVLFPRTALAGDIQECGRCL